MMYFRSIPLFLVFWILASCDFGPSQIEKEFKASIDNFARILQDYKKIPVKQELYGSGFIQWRDPEHLQAFYKENREDLVSIDDMLNSISHVKSENPWWDDAVFGRAILYSFWSLLGADKETLEKAISILTEFSNLSSSVRLETFTKTKMHESFFEAYEHVFTAGLSYEQNVTILLQGYIGYLFIILEKYEQAIRQYELIAKTYPNSKYSENLKDHIALLKDVKDGKVIMPSAPPLKTRE